MRKSFIFIGFLIVFILILSFQDVQAYENYFVRKGDTIWEISRTYGVPVEIILNNNNISNPSRVYIGQRLIISRDNDKISITINPESTNNKKDVDYINYTVKPGDSLWKIANENNISIQELMNCNNIYNNYNLYIGQKILIPVKADNIDTVENNYIYYTVKAGDILWNIAQKYNTTVKRLVELNNIKNAYDLYVGRRLLVAVNDSSYNNNEQNQSGDVQQNPNYRPYYIYKVKEGDKIWEIADKFGIKVSDLINFNNIVDLNDFNTDQVLIIPLEKSSKYMYLKKASLQLNNYYRVRSGENILSIAEYFNIPEEGLRTINNLKKDKEVYTGQLLLMPISPALFIEHELYRVKNEGEYIFDIAFNKGVSIKSILKANYMKDPNAKLDAGTIIIIALDEDSKTKWIEYENGKPKNSWLY
jgi:LysM repeat protein